jgi:branched-chain amino acid transport system substrate-binding protein
VGSLALVAEQTVAAAPEEVFALFGAHDAGWVFAAECDRLAVGSVVSLILPLGTPGSGDTVEVLGRIAGLAQGRRIVIAHDQPWCGRLRVGFTETEPGWTKVTINADVGEQGLEWLLRRRGWPALPPHGEHSHRIGLLTSKSGPGAVFAVACEYLARLAVDEINSEGGLHGRPVSLLVGDDATDAAVGAREAKRLIGADCRVVLASVTSATFGAVEQVLTPSSVPLVHTVLNEGGAEIDHVFRLGERPGHQISAAARPFMRETGARHWFLVGDDYSWSHGAHRAARNVLPGEHGVIVGERFIPLGTKDFSSVIEDIARSGADLVLSTLVGADEVAFERQSFESGLRSRCRTLSLVLDESTRERAGDRAAAGLWTTFGYFQQLPTTANTAFLARYRDNFGPWAPPVSSLSESVYDAVHLYAAAARNSRDDAPGAISAQLRRLRADVPRGRIELDGSPDPRQDLHVAEAVAGGFRLLDSHHQKSK